MVSGVLFGLGAALFQSVSYIMSRIFIWKHNRDVIKLLATSHAIIGVFSCILLPFFWPEEMPAFSEYGLSLFSCFLFYMLGQAALFMALGRSDASRISPLLGLKVLILALISVLFLSESFSRWQWLSVLLSLAAAFVLASRGGRIGRQSLVWILLACLGYCFSDLGIRVLVREFMYMGLGQASVFTASMTYVLCGVASVVILLFLPRTSAKMWLASLPFAVSWFIGILFLFACFASIGVVFGNIVQSTRGTISIVLGFAIAHAGFEFIEQKVSRKVFIQRIIAALLMTFAIAMYYLGE